MSVAEYTETATLSDDQAEAIIIEAKQYHAFNGPMPVDPKERQDVALGLLKSAKDARKGGVNSEIVNNIIALAENRIIPQDEPDPEPTPAEEAGDANIVASLWGLAAQSDINRDDLLLVLQNALGIQRITDINDDLRIRAFQAVAAEIANRAAGLPPTTKDHASSNGVYVNVVEEDQAVQIALVPPPITITVATDGTEAPPWDGPSTPIVETPAEEPKRGRRKRASDGSLHYADEMEAYEGSLSNGEVQRDPDLGGDGQTNYEQQGVWVTPPSSNSASGAAGVTTVTVNDTPSPSQTKQAFGNLTQGRFASTITAQAKLRKENLPEPPEITGETFELPVDFTTVSDEHIRRLHSAYHAYLSRATYLLACEEADLDAATRMHDMTFNSVLLKIAHEEPGVTVAKAEANLDTRVQELKDLIQEHRATVNMIKVRRDYYDGTCQRLSREWTMRTAESSSAGGLR